MRRLGCQTDEASSYTSWVMSEYGPPRRLSRGEIEAALNKEGMSLSTLKKPENWNLDRAKEMMDRLFEDERVIEWLKEMAKR